MSVADKTGRVTDRTGLMADRRRDPIHTTVPRTGIEMPNGLQTPLIEVRARLMTYKTMCLPTAPATCINAAPRAIGVNEITGSGVSQATWTGPPATQPRSRPIQAVGRQPNRPRHAHSWNAITAHVSRVPSERKIIIDKAAAHGGGAEYFEQPI